ncbi:delta-60 repeat domain-containing protein/Por secretion system C-terminal sorting domain-containing protein [Paenimyroides aquimaris]|uniref:Delta-60 repeat domain-containing protein/Por secretion system C-terminal sorting domain-containing protein n=1 Tax=Paenimyroides marinum TaxID=1159016 RepID=A0A1H6K5M0_9FLAO|nr:T9SS type A sorting domain-containing protein [Paenimyroides aquimaris]SEH70239.1 delta-60 repeat domain-containing protein/Por secretion system C-terminal sorting domain-containing protein [Paenimyroides aquimaris]
MKKIITFFVFCFTSIMFCQAQYLDTNFGNQGSVSEIFTGKQSRPEEIIYLDDGKFLILSFRYDFFAGMWSNFDFYLSRYHANGKIDTSFGTNGFLVYSSPSTSQRAPLLNMFKLNDGKIMVHCYHDNSTRLIRFSSIGVIDSSFGTNGEVNLSTGEYYKIVQTANNKFLLLGQYYDGYNNMYQFARLNTNGTFDTTFGTNGTKIVDPTAYRFDLISDIAYTTDDKIITIGMSYDSSTTTKGVIARFTSLGVLDTSFGTNGLVTLDVNTPGNNALLKNVAIQQNNGTIVICGDAMSPGGTGGFYGAQPFLAKINKNGTMVKQFGTNGIKYYNTIFQANDSFTGINFHNNTILISGTASKPFPYMQTFYYLRLVNNDGSDVIDFGNNGIMLLNLGTTTPDVVNHFNKTLIVDNQIYGLGMSTYIKGLDYATTFFKLKKGTLSNNEQLAQQFNMYPNPATNIVNITNSENLMVKKVIVYDIAGKQLSTHIFNNEPNIQLNIENLASGNYLLHLHTSQGVAVKKLIKL